MKVLAFDFGASSGRGIVFELKNGKVEFEEIHRFDNEPVMINGRFKWDVLRLFHEIKVGISKCVKLHDIGAIGIDTWGVDYGLLDSNGELLGNPYHYRDARTAYIEFTEDERKMIFDSTGIQFMAFNTLLQRMADSKERVNDIADTALFMPDLFNYFLTGEKRTEYTLASTGQILNAKARDFDNELLAKFNIKNIFAPIIRPGEIVGMLSDEICAETGCKKIPVIAVASHDTASAVVSVPMEDPKKCVYISTGTWMLFGIETDECVINEKSYKYNYTNEGGAFDKYRFLHNIMGLWLLQESRREWKKDDPSLSFAQMASEAGEAQPFKCIIHPNDDIFSAPGDMPKRIREFAQKTNQPIPETRGEVTRCIIEGLALQCMHAVNEMCDIVSNDVETINMVGGGIQNELLCQFVANATGKRVVAGPVEATGTGNAMMQFYALGEVSGLEQVRGIIKDSFDVAEYVPQDTEAWQAAYSRFCEVIDLTK